MAQSKYDSDGDGLCDADVCNDVLMVNRNYDPWTQYTPIVQASLEQIGIHLKIRELDVSTAYTTIQTMNNLVPIAINAGGARTTRARTGSTSSCSTRRASPAPGRSTTRTSG